MKGFIFAGCSFTWGQGLYYYSDLPNLIKMSDSEFHQTKITDAQIKFKNTLYFPRLVVNHFNTFEIVKYENGGNDYGSFEFIDGIFKSNNRNGFFTYDDIEYIILQTSQITRNQFSFVYEGINYQINLPSKNNPNISENEKIFMKYLVQQNITFDEWYEIFKKQVFLKIKNFLKGYEEKGIKTKILCWQDDLVKLILDDIEMSKKLIILQYDNKQFKCINHLMVTENGMFISNDNKNLNNPPSDHHPSKLCHQIIANSIIKNIENK